MASCRDGYKWVEFAPYLVFHKSNLNQTLCLDEWRRIELIHVKTIFGYAAVSFPLKVCHNWGKKTKTILMKMSKGTKALA